MQLPSAQARWVAIKVMLDNNDPFPQKLSLAGFGHVVRLLEGLSGYEMGMFYTNIEQHILIEVNSPRSEAKT